MSGDPPDDSLRGDIEAAIREVRARNQAPYDGVMGGLPEWMPGSFHEEFHAIRGQLLAAYPRDDLLRFIADVRATSTLADGTYSRPSTPFEIWNDISRLAQLQEAVDLGPEAGLALLTDPGHAKRAKMGEDHSRQQSKKARKPRGKIEGDDGVVESIGAIIGRLALSSSCALESAKELWPHLFSELGTLGLAPEDDANANRYLYGFKGRRKSLTFGQFANVVSQYRKKKSG